MMCSANPLKVSKYSIREALCLLLQVTNDSAKGEKKKCKKRKKEESKTMTDFDIRRRVAICRFLDMLLNGYDGTQANKMTASAFVARILYDKENVTSCI